MEINYAQLKSSGFMRQKQGDRFSLRVHVVGGRLTVEKMNKITEIADVYGNGYVHLTSRQSVEIPFIKLEDIDMVRKELEKVNCSPTICGGGVRTITACQGNAICKSGNIDSYHIAQELEKRYQGRILPHKFKMGVTGCQNNCLKAEENDLGIKGAADVSWNKESCILCGACEKVCRRGAIKRKGDLLLCDKRKCNHCGRCTKICPKKALIGESAYIVSFGGLFGNTISKGEVILPLIKSEEQLFRVVDAAITFFDENAYKGERFKFTIDRIGVNVFKQRIKEAYEI